MQTVKIVVQAFSQMSETKLVAIVALAAIALAFYVVSVVG